MTNYSNAAQTQIPAQAMTTVKKATKVYYAKTVNP